MRMSISVVVPVYNVEKYIDRCVNSIMRKLPDNSELLLIDDGSTDKSGKICDEIQLKDERIKSLHKVNGGLGDARNFGLMNAKCEYIVFIDSDDYVTDNYFEIIIPELSEHNPDILKFGYQRIVNGNACEKEYPFFELGLYNKEEILNKIVPAVVGPIRLFDYSKNTVMSACCAAYRREFLIDNNIFFKSERVIHNEDYLFNYEAVLKANTIFVKHDTPYMYDFREGSLSKAYVQNAMIKNEKLMMEYKELLKKSDLFERFEIQYYNQCVDLYYACITNECSRWADHSLSKKNISMILNSSNCVYALKKCNKKKLSIKSEVIYILMKLKFGSIMYYLYKSIKR